MGVLQEVTSVTVRVNGWLALGVTPLAAWMVNLYVRGSTDDVPARVAVPFLLSVRVTPVGKVDPGAKVMAGVGDPVVVTE
jgi:hypothetical protein